MLVVTQRHRFRIQTEEDSPYLLWEDRIVAIAADCKSAPIRVRGFESLSSHKVSQITQDSANGKTPTVRDGATDFTRMPINQVVEKGNGIIKQPS